MWNTVTQPILPMKIRNILKQSIEEHRQTSFQVIVYGVYKEKMLWIIDTWPWDTGNNTKYGPVAEHPNSGHMDAGREGQLLEPQN